MYCTAPNGPTTYHHVVTQSSSRSVSIRRCTLITTRKALEMQHGFVALIRARHVRPCVQPQCSLRIIIERLRVDQLFLDLIHLTSVEHRLSDLLLKVLHQLAASCHADLVPRNRRAGKYSPGVSESIPTRLGARPPSPFRRMAPGRAGGRLPG